MIKKEFWEDDKISECSVSARLLFIALWNLADDEGYLERRPKWIKAKCFPYDNIDVEPLLDELFAKNFITEQGNIILVKNFLKHQLINRPTPSILSQKFKDSLSTHGVISEDSVPNIKEINIMENKGKESLCPTDEAKNPDRKKIEEGAEAYRLAVLLWENVRANNDKARNPNLQSWAADIDRMLRIDKLTFQEVEAVILWCQQDSFWKSNILSAEKLRKQFPQLWIKAKTEFQSKQNKILIV